MSFELSSIVRVLFSVGVVQQTGDPKQSSSMESPASCKLNSDAPKSLLEVLKPEDVKTCVETYPVSLNIKESGTIRFANGSKIEFNFGRLVDEKKLLWKLDTLTWEDIASIVYPKGTDPKTAAAELKKVNRNVELPYELISDAQGASYRYLRLAKGEGMLSWVSSPLPNFGSIPVISVNVPELPVDKCLDLRAKIAEYETLINGPEGEAVDQSVKGLLIQLDEKISFVQGKVYRDVVSKAKNDKYLFIVYQADPTGVAKPFLDDEAIQLVENIKAEANTILNAAQALLKSGCQNPGDILKSLDDVKNKLEYAIANLNFAEMKPKAQSSGPGRTRGTGKSDPTGPSSTPKKTRNNKKVL